MAESVSGDLAKQNLVDVLRSLSAAGSSGVLQLTSASGTRRLYFIDGQLHLPSSAVRSHMGELNELLDKAAASAETGGWGHPRVRALLSQIASFIGGWQTGSYRFDPRSSDDMPELLGPLPTDYILLEARLNATGPDSLLEELGGADLMVVAVPTGLETGMLLELGGRETALLSTLEEPQTLGAILARSSRPPATLRSLYRLDAFGLIGPVKPEDLDQWKDLATPELLQRLAERVENDLAARPLDLDDDRHRERIVALAALAEVGNYYQLLAVQSGSSPEEVQNAYIQTARLVHPLHSAKLTELSAEVLGSLFQKITEAYLVLSDPERSSRYSEHHQGPEPGSDPEARYREQVKLALRDFEKAERLAAAGEYHYAIELLRQVVVADPRPEYYALLGRCQARNPNWLGQAMDSFRHAVRALPEDVVLRLELAAVLEEAGRERQALLEYRAALRLDPDSQEAREGLDRLAPADRSGILRSLFLRNE